MGFQPSAENPQIHLARRGGKHFDYAFPYRDGGQYPALGMLFASGGPIGDMPSLSLIERTDRYLVAEKARARTLVGVLESFEGVLVWGAGDNFFRSAGNGGPLSDLRNMVLLDRSPREVTISDRTYRAMDPQAGLQKYPWPVVLTVSEGSKNLSRAITETDPGRRIILV